MSERGRKCQRQDAIRAAIERLAMLFPYGALQADTDPAAFLQRCADEIEALRATPPVKGRE